MTDVEPHGTLMRSNYTGMVLVKLRYFWVNLNDSVRRYDAELDFSEWTVTHRPEPVTQPSERAEAPRSDECCMDCYGPCQAAKPQPSDLSAKQVGTSPEHANETPESWHVDVLDLEGYRADPHYDNGGSPQ
jgi:hypothetical protein